MISYSAEKQEERLKEKSIERKKTERRQGESETVIFKLGQCGGCAVMVLG